MKNVSAKWALENKDNINIIDVRLPKEYAKGHIEGSINIPYPGIVINYNQFLNTKENYYFICRTGGRSSAVVRALEDKGIKSINVEGGNEKIGLA